MQKYLDGAATVLDEKDDPNAFADLSAYEIVYRSPGVPLAKIDHPNISSVTKFFFEKCPCPIIGITGTKGKGTTSTLIYEMLKAAGRDVYLGGNIGEPPVNFLGQLNPESIVILELSSFQLEDLTQSPHIAVVLNVTSEHLDVHPNTEAYREAKQPIVKFQSESDHAFISDDYEGSRAFAPLGAGQKHLFHAHDGSAPLPVPREQIGLRGDHNLENITPAVLVARHLEIPEDTIAKVLTEFKGLPNRLEPTGEINGVQYFNDSFSTTPETSIAAARAFTEPLYLIAGGSEKNSDFTEWGQVMSNLPHLKKVLLIGLTAPKLGALLPPEKVEMAETLEAAIEYTKQNAQPGDVVVMSPACASFDQFKNYKARGQRFRDLTF